MAPRTVLDKARETRSNWEARVRLLHERGRSLTTVADRLGVDRAYVSRVNRGTQAYITKKNAQRVEREIARQLSLSLEDAFPERYGSVEGVA